MSDLTRTGIFWRLVNILSTACLLTMTIVMLRRELRDYGQAAAGIGEAAQVAPGVAQRTAGRQLSGTEWTLATAAGHVLHGAAGARVEIVVFSDFQCPYCARFANLTLPMLKDRFGDDVLIRFRHWPLQMHEHAYWFARGAECAAEQGRFRSFHDAVFSMEPARARASTDYLARQAEIPDLPRFYSCVRSTNTVPAIDADIAAVKALGGRGTPTVVINGLLVRAGNTPEALVNYVHEQLRNTRNKARPSAAPT